MLNVTEICSGITYVGVNDRTTARFESLWPLTKGVSYNSYFVEGNDKVALIDSVAIGEFPEFLAILRDRLQTSGCKGIDYLVVNHMEPDHSGSIPELLRAFPEIKIVGNRQTIGMISGFYSIDDPDRFLEVKEGDRIDLGGKTLRFFLTPMVHWPETMMTYAEEDKALFSGDAFGCFGALNGGVTDREMDTDWYRPEMERYYSCIVGKYGKFVQKAIAKLTDVALEHICPTHGPVWEEKIPEVKEVYSTLSAYKPLYEGATIVYGSMYGNTAVMAEAMARELTRLGVRKVRVHNASFSSLDEMITDAFRYPILIVGGPTYSMGLFPPVEQFMRALETRELKNRRFATFGSHTWAATAAKALGAYAERLGWESAGHVEVKQSARKETLAQLAEVAEKLMEKPE